MSYVKDNFFEFPIKMYDVYSMMNAEIQEDKQVETEGVIAPKHVDSTSTLKQCRPESIIGWIEAGDRGQSVQELEEEGFNRSIITVLEGQDRVQYECLWTKAKFEEKLNKWMEKKLI